MDINREVTLFYSSEEDVDMGGYSAESGRGGGWGVGIIRLFSGIPGRIRKKGHILPIFGGFW